MEKFKAQPIILIQVKGMGFTFLVDTSYKYNLLTSCFVDFFHEEYPASREKIEFHERLNLHFPSTENPELYNKQLCERDAKEYADMVMQMLEGDES